MMRSAGHRLVLTVICLPRVSVSVVFSARLSMKPHCEYLMTPVALATDSSFYRDGEKEGSGRGAQEGMELLCVCLCEGDVGELLDILQNMQNSSSWSKSSMCS